jgi:hypothetical protein
MWNFFRVENEQLNNTGSFRATKEIPLPFSQDQLHVNFVNVQKKKRMNAKRNKAAMGVNHQLFEEKEKTAKYRESATRTVV